MLPESPFLQLVPGRVQQLMGRVQGQIWQDQVSVPIYRTPASEQHLTLAQARELPLEKIDGPQRWGKMFDQLWVKIELPSGDRPKYLQWREQGESTLFLDGVPYYGFDPAHQQCELPEGDHELWMEVMCCETGIWVPGGAARSINSEGCNLAGAQLLSRNDAAWRAALDLRLLFELLAEEHRALYPQGGIYGGGFGYIEPVAKVSVLFRRMLRRLDEAVTAYDNGGLPALQAELDAIFTEFPADSLALDCVLTGHAHIDLVWLWPEKAGDFKAVHTFASMARLMDLYPEFRFNYTQPASYQAVGRRSPELLAKVKDLTQAGSWEMTGASYVENDTQMACGEALSRGVVIGQGHYRELRGEPARVLWLPDVFGYTACLPQILRQTGVDFFYTTKLTWCSINRFPYSSFRWIGHDGSEVVAHVSQDFGYNSATGIGELKAGQLGYRQSDVHDKFLMPTGYGDGGGGTTEEMCERARRLSNLASMPKVRWGTIEGFFDDLSGVRDRLPAWRGELYLEYHRGVMTTHSHCKAAFRGLERALQAQEAANAALGAGPVDQHAWERLVFSQFHDYIPGSSIHEVYDEGVAELNGLAEQALAEAESDLSATGGQPALFNPLAIERTVATERGRVTLSPLSGAPLADLPLAPLAPAVAAGTDFLDNGRVRAEFAADGAITRLVVDGQSVAMAQPLGGLVVYPDHPHAYPAWDIDRATLANPHPVTSAATVTLESAEDDVAVLAFAKPVTEKSSVVIRYRLEAGASALQVEYDLDWQDYDTLLKVLFPTDYQGRNARYGHPYGSVLRSQQPGEERDEAQWEVCASRWAAVCDDTERDGLYVVTQDKYGFTCRAGVLGLSLVRSAGVTNERDNRPIRRTLWEHPVSDIGRHQIRIALGAYRADLPRAEQPAALADLLYTPAVAYEGGAISTGLVGLDGGDSLQPAWVKPLADGSFVLRLHETLGQRGVLRLALREGWSATAVDLLEKPTNADLSDGLAYGPYQLISVRIGRT